MARDHEQAVGHHRDAVKAAQAELLWTASMRVYVPEEATLGDILRYAEVALSTPRMTLGWLNPGLVEGHRRRGCLLAARAVQERPDALLDAPDLLTRWLKLSNHVSHYSMRAGVPA